MCDWVFQICLVQAHNIKNICIFKFCFEVVCPVKATDGERKNVLGCLTLEKFFS